ncbi:MAG: stress response translation initiation inhibitor YciH [Candidatus ainarchaeum sp.]|nr:stress response translation initiation inhibitor YciH [Candidatus ainarchaeum sp.]
MQEIDKISGLPKDLFDITNITKGQQQIRISVKKIRFKKLLTIISGINEKILVKELGKEMKHKFACGGTVKENIIELQGDHKEKVKKFLIMKGYNESLIEM